MPNIELLRMWEVIGRRGRGRSKLYVDIKAGTMTPPVKRGKTALWPAHEIDVISWAEIAGANDDELRALVQALLERRALGKPPTTQAA